MDPGRGASARRCPCLRRVLHRLGGARPGRHVGATNMLVLRRTILMTTHAGEGAAGSFGRQVAVAIVLAPAGLCAPPAEIPGIVIKKINGGRLVLHTGKQRLHLTLSENN